MWHFSILIISLIILPHVAQLIEIFKSIGGI